MQPISSSSPTCTIHRISGKALPDIPFASIKNTILGASYELSLVFESTARAEELHKKFKKKSDPANILSFPYSDQEGEIIMHLGSLRSEAKNYQRSYYEHLTFMFIHGCLHLKGYLHGKDMEIEEKKYMKKFVKYVQKTF